jgi:hypothetical protein
MAAQGKPYNEYHGKPGKRNREVFRKVPKTDRLLKRYRVLYWDICELQLISCDNLTSDSQAAIAHEINLREIAMAQIVDQLGFTPAA